MTDPRMDPEVQILAAISATLQADYAADDAAWQGSPFAWLRSCPSRQKGAIGEKLVAGWLAARGFNVARTGWTLDKPTILREWKENRNLVLNTEEPPVPIRPG